VEGSNQISNDPFSRIPTSMLKVLSQEEVFFDVHCHVFNYRDIPDKFLGIRVPLNLRVLSFLENILHLINNRSDKDKLSNLAYFINFPKSRTTIEISEKLFS
jgi:hypothetical protein